MTGRQGMGPDGTVIEQSSRDSRHSTIAVPRPGLLTSPGEAEAMDETTIDRNLESNLRMTDSCKIGPPVLVREQRGKREASCKN